MRLVATIITVMVIAVGFAISSPLFFRQDPPEAKQKVMLCFDVLESGNPVDWCHNLSDILNEKNLAAIVFILGKVAQENPQCTTLFGDKVDIGSQTYSNVALASIEDYSIKLQEVQDGKAAIDEAGNLTVRTFRAARGETDDDIYSLLNRCSILADFSYPDHYNIYENDQFVKYDATVYEGRNYSPDYFLNSAKSAQPIIINFDSNDATANIEDFISKLQTGNFEFVNASELAGLALTSRGAA